MHVQQRVPGDVLQQRQQQQRSELLPFSGAAAADTHIFCDPCVSEGGGHDESAVQKGGSASPFPHGNPPKFRTGPRPECGGSVISSRPASDFPIQYQETAQNPALIFYYYYKSRTPKLWTLTSAELAPFS